MTSEKRPEISTKEMIKRMKFDHRDINVTGVLHSPKMHKVNMHLFKKAQRGK